MIGITPQGTMLFISKGWGVCAAEKYITEYCGLYKNLPPGDLVLADRGFNIENSAGLYAAQLHIPSFTPKLHSQLWPLAIETTITLACVRIHVKRVCRRYRILGHGVIPI